jgi:pyruvate dehydrogenase E2 component (dihydrolipoyllysine-residue acetyltransferase)
MVITDANGNDSIAIRPMVYLCMSWDHRVLDGALAAQFLSTLKGRIEAWPSER